MSGTGGDDPSGSSAGWSFSLSPGTSTTGWTHSCTCYGVHGAKGAVLQDGETCTGRRRVENGDENPECGSRRDDGRVVVGQAEVTVFLVPRRSGSTVHLRG